MIAADLNKYDTPLAELDKKHIDLEKEHKDDLEKENKTSWNKT